MSEQSIEYFINGTLAGGRQRNALEFAAYLVTSEMQLERGGGYWEDKLYWCVNYKGKSVCYILIDDDSWFVWSDDSGSNSFEDFPLSENMKEIVWNNLVICEKTDRCFDGCARKRKTIFGKEFDNVCGTTLKFANPNADEVECMKKIFEIRKNRIDPTAGYL